MKAADSDQGDSEVVPQPWSVAGICVIEKHTYDRRIGNDTRQRKIDRFPSGHPRQTVGEMRRLHLRRRIADPAKDLHYLFSLPRRAWCHRVQDGSVFAAAWVRFGVRGPQLLAIGLIVVIGLGIAIIVPDLAVIVATFQLWWLAIAAGVFILLASLGTWLFLRAAIIR